MNFFFSLYFIYSEFEYLNENDSIQSLSKLLALNHDEAANEELLAALNHPIRKNDRFVKSVFCDRYC